MGDTVRYEREGAVARVTMDRPRYRNAQSRVLLEDLDAAFAEAMADHEVRVVVLFGEGNVGVVAVFFKNDNILAKNDRLFRREMSDAFDGQINTFAKTIRVAVKTWTEWLQRRER